MTLREYTGRLCADRIINYWRSRGYDIKCEADPDGVITSNIRPLGFPPKVEAVK